MKPLKEIPKDYIDGLKENYKSDMISGFLVFLIALPLCLGVSKASGFPPIAGIYTAIIGGMFVSLFSGSLLTIKGPAAGLIVIALGSVTELGKGDFILGYKLTLAVIVVSGIIQILFGFLKAGILSDFFPTSVIHGMLAAIGIIIFSKQIHFALGVVPVSSEAFELLEEIPHSFLHLNPEVAFISLISLSILFIKPIFKNPIVKLIPAPLIVLGVAIPLGLYFDLSHEHNYDLGSLSFHINPAQLLVALPSSFLSGITLPDFSQIFSFTAIKYIIMFALVGSIESLLSAKAIDILDPHKRKSNFNKDLIAVGLGNMFAGFIGGLPMISEIVRSSSNINNGAKTRWANFFHGFFLLTFVVLAAPLIQMIPNAALAAMLMYTGYNLAAPKEFVHTYKIGFEQIVIFCTTIIVTLTTDLLLGVMVGILLKILIHFINGASKESIFKLKMEIINQGNRYIIKLNDAAMFSNFIPFKNALKDIPKNAFVSIDFSSSPLVDHTFMEGLQHIESDFYDNGGKVELKGLENYNYFSQHPLAGRKKIINPTFVPHLDDLSPRQLLLLTFSEKNNFDFDSKRNSNILKFSFGQFPLIRKSKFAENTIAGTKNNYQFIFADINIAQSAELSLNRNYINISVLFISNIKNVQIPNFVLKKEQFFDKIKEIQGSIDIDFPKYPTFSDFYFLTGENEKEVRKFFKSELIKLLETENVYAIEANNNILLIHQKLDLFTVPQYESTLTFADKLVAVIQNKI